MACAPARFAQQLAQARGVALEVVFNVVPRFLEATQRQSRTNVGSGEALDPSVCSHALPGVRPPMFSSHGPLQIHRCLFLDFSRIFT